MAESMSDLTTAQALSRLVERAQEALGLVPECLPAGSPLLEEGSHNSKLYILLEGTAQLLKLREDGGHNPVDLLGPGSLLGILSFWTGKPAFTHSVAATDVRVLKLERQVFEQGVLVDPEFARLTQQLFIANLSDRYRRVVSLNLKVAGLTRELEQERNALREAVADLRRTRNKLIHQEKLATMGQLLAGIAHEINNPSTALMKSVELLMRELPELFAGAPEQLALLQAGLRAPYLSSGEARDRLEALQTAYPEIPRSLCRRLSRLPAEAQAGMTPLLRAGQVAQIEALLRVFEVGSSLNSIRIAESRITRLVKSLKSYSRQDESEYRQARLEDCVQDTLTVLNHRLKHYDLQLDLAALPEVPCRPGEINQILTNLLTNACEATEPGRQISMVSGEAEDHVWLEVRDQGHGIPEELLEAIFRPNITTKSGGGDYGLGLGLAISRDLAQKHQGRLNAHNLPGGGACFRLELPKAL